MHSGGRIRGDAAQCFRGEFRGCGESARAANGDATRVTIDLEDSVQYAPARIANPDRIFFDLHAARLTPEVARGNIHVDGNLLTAVRVAQNHAGVVRVVLDVNGVKDYTASLMNNPPQLVIDLYSDLRHGTAVRSGQSRKPRTRKADPSGGNREDRSASGDERECQNVCICKKSRREIRVLRPRRSSAIAECNGVPAGSSSSRQET